MTRTRQPNLLALSIASAMAFTVGCGNSDNTTSPIPPPAPGQWGGTGGGSSVGSGGVGGSAPAPTPPAPTPPAAVPPIDRAAVQPDDYAWLSKPLPVIWMTLEPGQTIPAPGQAKLVRALGRAKIIQDHDGSPVTAIEGKNVVIDAPILLEHRGSSSYSVGRIFNGSPGYNLEFHDGNRNGVGRVMLGMPKNADWAFVICGSDKTCIRNAFTYATGREIVAAAGRWAPRFRWAEVYLNGTYLGVYTIAEKPKDDKNRVDLPSASAITDPAQQAYLISSDADCRAAQTNGYDLLNPTTEFLDSRARASAPPAGSTMNCLNAGTFVPGNRRWKIRSPDPENDLSGPGRTYIQTAFDKMTTTLETAAPNWKTAIDLPSFIDYYVISEFSNNVDAFFKSWYMYKMPDVMGGKWFMGPIWDYDLAYGNANYYFRYCANTTALGALYKVSPADKDDPPPPWAIAPLKDPAVQNDLRCRWNQLRAAGGPLALDRIEARIDSFVTHLRTAKARDTAKWMNYPKYVWPNNYVAGSWDDDVRYLKFWIRARLAWVDRGMVGTCATTPNPGPVAQVPPPPSVMVPRVTPLWGGQLANNYTDYVNILSPTPAEWACPAQTP